MSFGADFLGSCLYVEGFHPLTKTTTTNWGAACMLRGPRPWTKHTLGSCL